MGDSTVCSTALFRLTAKDTSKFTITGLKENPSVTSEWIWPHHDDVIKWKHFQRYWPFVRGIHRSPVNSPHKGQWRGGLMFTLICARINAWVNNREAGDLIRYRTHSDVIVVTRSVRRRAFIGHDDIPIKSTFKIAIFVFGTLHILQQGWDKPALSLGHL